MLAYDAARPGILAGRCRNHVAQRLVHRDEQSHGRSVGRGTVIGHEVSSEVEQGKTNSGPAERSARVDAHPRERLVKSGLERREGLGTFQAATMGTFHEIEPGTFPKQQMER